MPLKDLCKLPLITLSPEAKITEAAKLMQESKVGSVIITQDEKPVGILTDRDIVVRVIAPRKDPSTTPISEVMTRNVVVANESSGTWDVIQLMKHHGVRRFPVVSGSGKLTGIIALDDLIELLGEELSALGRAIWSQEEPMRERKH
jgi:CBS domain-containing protein